MEQKVISSLFESQRQHKWIVKNSTVKDRKIKLNKLKKAVADFTPKFIEAMYLDFKKPEVELLLTEIYPVNCEIDDCLSKLGQWMSNQKVDTPIALLGTSSYVKYEAKGNTLILSPWNYPINLTLIPLVSAIAAGNTSIIKPSEYTPNTSQVLAELIAQTFESEEVAVILGDANTATELLKLPFDHIFFTGSTTVGKIIMRAAAENLSSVTLELGGKSPCIVEDNANIDAAAKKIVYTKFLNCGQTCLAPDYILVHESIKYDFTQKLIENIRKFYGNEKDIETSNSYPRIVNQKHTERLHNLILDATIKGAKILIGGRYDAKANFLSPTVITNVDYTMSLMQEEIFGPILPIITFTNLDEVIEQLQGKDKPLASYIFSENQKNIQKYLNKTSSGAVCINDATIHFINSNLPFGGSNHSGIGRCHGKAGFLEFSNTKSILKQHFASGAANFLMPPYTPKVMRLVKIMLKWL